MYEREIEVHHKKLKKIHKKWNVHGSGIGYKVIDGKETETLAIVVTVEKKIPKCHLKRRDRIPKKIKGIPTDVIQGDRFVAFENNERLRPVTPGYSIGHVDITAGTFGCLAYQEGEPYIISNNHVMANSNEAEIGDAIIQPGAYDEGTFPNDHVANLHAFKEIRFSGPLDFTCKFPEPPYTIEKLIAWLTCLIGGAGEPPVFFENRIDAAIAKPLPTEEVTDYIPHIGVPIGVKTPELGMMAHKTGRTTEYTELKVTQIDYQLTVNYSRDPTVFKEARFTGQTVLVSVDSEVPGSAAGDSGSAILDLDGNLIGLLFAGNDTMTIAMPIQEVLDEFGLTAVKELFDDKK